MQVRSDVDIKLILTERARARKCGWEPPPVGAEIEVEVEDEHTPHGPEWRRAKVSSTFSAVQEWRVLGRGACCVARGMQECCMCAVRPVAAMPSSATSTTYSRYFPPQVTRVCSDLSIVVTIVRPNGELDPLFVEDYSRTEEGTEWRRV